MSVSVPVRGGRAVSQETFDGLLKNRLFKGEVFVEGWGKVVKGDFEPLVSPELFDKVQAILEGRAPAPVAHVKDREDFALRGFVLCAECPKPLTASFSTGKLGNKFGYYHCHRAAGHVSIRMERLEGDFIALLERLVPSPDRTALIISLFVDVWKTKLAGAEAESKALRQELGRLASNRKRALGTC